MQTFIGNFLESDSMTSEWAVVLNHNVTPCHVYWGMCYVYTMNAVFIKLIRKISNLNSWYTLNTFPGARSSARAQSAFL